MARVELARLLTCASTHKRNEFYTHKNKEGECMVDYGIYAC